MNRISLILLPALILAVFAPIAPQAFGAPANQPENHQGTSTATPPCSPEGDTAHHSGCVPTATPTASSTPSATPTFTPTGTPTGTPTSTPTSNPAPCQSFNEKADFAKVPVGSSVEGVGLLAHDLNIGAAGTAVRIVTAAAPVLYAAKGSSGIVPNGGLAPGGGFGDIGARRKGLAHHYTFTFPPTVSVCSFSLHMLDFGDLNPTRNTAHIAILRGYDWTGLLLVTQKLSYKTKAEALPRSSDRYGNLQITGDALTSSAGQPGNWLWHIEAPGITKVTLDFGAGFDPNIGFDELSFDVEGTTPTPGLLLRGHVRLQDGSGLAGVKICRSYAMYSGEVVATTNQDGYFESPFAYIPGDEMVHVWALADGYSFDPPYYFWRHYHSVEIRTADFVAAPGATASASPYPCFPAPPPFGP